jgi:predicted SAM-dependent methyltransferase
MVKLNLGCGGTTPQGWINVDYALGAKLARVPLFKTVNKRFKLFNMDWNPEIYLHDLCKPFPWSPNSVDVVYSSHTLAHMLRDDGRRFLGECHKVLKPGGVIRIVVPDLKPIIDRYVSGDITADYIFEELWCLYRPVKGRIRKILSPYMQYPHKCMYDPSTLLKVMTQVGFQVEQKGYCESRIEDIADIEIESRTVDAVVVEGIKG